MFVMAFTISLVMPMLGLVIVNLQATFYKRYTDPEWETESKIWLCIFAGVIIFFVLFTVLEKSIFGVMGEKLTLKLRCELIEEILHKQISWFDREDRAPGILTNVIASDITQLNGMTSETLVSVVEVICIFTFGVSLGMYINLWSALTCALISPIMIVGMFLYANM